MQLPELRALFDACSNAGRWGPADERGTANYIDQDKVTRALRIPRHGRVLSLGHELSPQSTRKNWHPIVQRVLYTQFDNPFACEDSVEITPHGFAVTHLDAPAHMNFEGRVYNARSHADVLSRAGLRTGSILAYRDGLITRGVLLDIASAQGKRWLSPAEAVTPADLSHAEQVSGVRIEAGDAVFVRVGLGAREQAEGEEDPSKGRAGLVPECLLWLHERRVGVYAGDCVDRLPSECTAVPFPFHAIGLAAMGLIFLDNPNMEVLATGCRDAGRNEFLVCASPLPIPGGTGSAINPIAIF